ILVLLFLNYELSYDTWDDRLENVYKVSAKEGNDILETTPAPLANFLVEKHPDVRVATAIQSTGDFEVQIDANEKVLFQKGVITIDTNFFDVFPYSLSRGSIEDIKDTPNAVVI